MTPSFSSILQQHTAAYPLMAPQDYGKLAYQNEFGPGHMISDKQAAFDFLLQEWREALLCPSRDAAPSGGPFPSSPAGVEPIGNGLCRFHLDNRYIPEQAAPLLTELFCRTAVEPTGAREGLERKLALLSGLGTPHLAQWLEDYRLHGCPPVHHSEAFRQAYHPHYRVVQNEYACFFPALLLLWQSMPQNSEVPLVVAIDGRCGSGKSRFASLVGRLFPCSVLHMDDFYLPEHRRNANWMQVPGQNIDFDALSGVLHTLRAGKTVSCRRFDCASGHYDDTLYITPQPLILLEGSYSMHPRLDADVDKSIFLTCAPQEQLRRLQRRQQGSIGVFESLWIPLEECYFQTFQVANSGDLTLDTTFFSEI